jgi:hypothetical protein
MKTYSWLHPNRFLSKSPHRLSSLTLLLVMVTLVAFALQSTRADTQVPFRGGFSTTFQSVLQFPFLYVTVEGQGNVSHMGLTSAFTDDQVVNLITGSTTATYTLTAANRDTVVLGMSFQVTQIPGGVTFAGDYTVTGGTGRFYEATGGGVLAGSAIFTGPNNGVGSFSVAGTISSPGS